MAPAFRCVLLKVPYIRKKGKSNLLQARGLPENQKPQKLKVATRPGLILTSIHKQLLPSRVNIVGPTPNTARVLLLLKEVSPEPGLNCQSFPPYSEFWQ